MATLLEKQHPLSDSNYKLRPPSQSYYRSDANSLSNNVQQIEALTQKRHMKFPTLRGRADVDSFKNPQNPTDSGYIKYNDEGDYRAHAPKRFIDSIIDPTCGFVTAAADVDRNTGHTHIKSMAPHPFTPQTTTPQSQHLIRPYDSAPPELRRQSEKDPGTTYCWNSRKVSDAQLRAMLGGWTSDSDPRLTASADPYKPRTPADDNRTVRDKLALKFMYTSSTQRAYEEVPWDGMLREPRHWPPTTTLERKADQVSHWCNTSKRYDEMPMEWQGQRVPPNEILRTIGRSWDAAQTRRGYYKKNAPVPGINFSSPCSRAQQIPLYGGCIGAENLEEIDNRDEPFTPYTVKRNKLPWVTDTAQLYNALDDDRPDIPKYDGCTWYRPESVPAHSDNAPYPGTPQTAAVHRPLYVTPNDSQHKRESKMSKMVTTVPPGNPFNNIQKEPLSAQKKQENGSAPPTGQHREKEQIPV